MQAKHFVLFSIEFFYKNILKKILFQFEPEKVHQNIVGIAEKVGENTFIASIAKSTFSVKDTTLEQDILGINFKNPIGLAAGFDYEGRLTQILPAIGFGFETIGTITNISYNGNPSPLLGRLPVSQSLMVNKGFKNLGAQATYERLAQVSFCIPTGISIGRSNNPICSTQKKSIQDILKSFILFESSQLKHSYYELNISCPNLFGNVNFYSPKHLQNLLKEIDSLHIKRPLFIKMPISLSNKDTLHMLEVIAKFSPQGVIVGNLQTKRDSRLFSKNELLQFPIGNFSGRPTYKRSNELIKLSYRNFGKRFVVIGTGGVFNGRDAYEKISLGANLVQLITGMIFKGPQLISQINLELIELLKRDGFANIHEARGQYA